jgi:RHS repeat-associated protein
MAPTSCARLARPDAHRLVGDPIDAVSGANTEITRDFRLTGPIPLDWRRHYDSSRAGSYFALGWGHSHEYERTLRFDVDGLRYVGPLGFMVTFPPLLHDGATASSAGLALRRLAPLRYEIQEAGQPTMEFAFADALRPAPLRALVQGGTRVDFRYRPDGALEGITDSAGRFVAAQCDGAGRVLRLAIVNADGTVQRDLVTYAYDEAGNLVVGSDAYRHAFSFGYDGANRLTRRTDQRGYTFHFVYDARGRCIHSFGEDGLHEVRLDYRPDEQRTLVTQADGGVWEYRHDDAGLLTAIVDPYGGARAYVNDADGKVVEETDANGVATTWVYDAAGGLLGRRSSLGHFSADPQGPLRPDQLAHRVPSRPSEWEYGDLLTPERLAPSGAGRERPPSQGDGSARASSWRSAGGVESPDPHPAEAAASEREEYDELGTLLREVRSDGRARHWVHDAGGNMIRYRDYDGSVFSYDYSSWDLSCRDVDPIGRARERRFTTSAAVATVVDPGGVATQYLYDLAGRVTELRHDGACVERYAYDAAGNRTATLDGAGRTLVEQAFGPDNLRASRRLASGETHRFAYTERGLYAAVATDDASVTFDYDEFSNRTRDARDGRGVAHRFAGPGLIEETVVLERFATRYRWLTESELEIRDPGGRTHVLAFPGDGAVVRALSSGVSEVASYDASGRCLAKATSRARAAGRGAPWVRRFSYSGEGDLLAAHDSAAGVRRYEYDEAHRLQAMVAENGTTSVFRHDVEDNLLEQPALAGVSIGRGNRLASANGADYEYDDRGNVSLRRGPSLATRYRYDSRNLLVACDTARGEWRATYDPLGRRVRKSLGDEWREFYWDTDRLAAEVGHDGRLRVYVYADAFALVPMLWLDYDSTDADPASGRRYFVFGDHLGTPVRVEDDGGLVVWRAQVAPYGSALVAAGARVEMPLRFPGHYHDAETGLHCNRFRYYVPELGRYLQPDPLGPYDGANIYAYSANPLADVDVRGDCAQSAKKKKEAAKKKPPQSTEDGDTAAGSIKPGQFRDKNGRLRNADGTFAREPRGPYSHLEDHPSVGEGKDFTAAQKEKIIAENKQRNGGVVKSDDPNDPHQILVKPSKSEEGVTPPQNEWQVDHIVPLDKGGSNSFTNARVVSRELNREKSNN